MLACTGVILIGIFAIGNSPKIQGAIKWRNKPLILTNALTGFGGGVARSLADLSVHVETAVGYYGACEDVRDPICYTILENVRVA